MDTRRPQVRCQATHPTRALLLPILKDAMSFSAMGEKEAEHTAEGIERLTWSFEYGEECGLKHGEWESG